MTQPPKYAQQYFVKDNCLFETGNNKQGDYTKKLCNFVPGANREIIKDDGISFERYVQLGGVHQSGRQLPEITIPAGDVEGLGWIVKYWGMDCILEPGLKTKASVWNAIQSTALNMERSTVFATTGWRHVDGNWRYLLPGDEQYTVELPGKMHGYGMERSYNHVDIQTAASLLWQSLAPEEIMLPLLSFTFLSPLNHFLKAAGCEPKFVLLLSGKTGSRKSTLAALMLSFFGKFTASELPLSFRDTANSILTRLARKQSDSIDEDKPTHVFIRKLYALLASGKGSVVSKDCAHDFKPANHIGYEDGTFFYLLGETAHAKVREHCDDQGEIFTIKYKALLKALAEENLIDPGPKQNTKLVRIGTGSNVRAVWLYKDKAEKILDSA